MRNILSIGMVIGVGICALGLQAASTTFTSGNEEEVFAQQQADPFVEVRLTEAPEGRALVSSQDAGGDANASLFNAVIAGDMPAAERALRAGANINAEFRKPGWGTRLKYWASGGLWQLYGWRPLHEAVHYGNIDMITFLLDRGAEINAPGKYYWPPLMRAIYHENYPVVRLLLERRADVNVKFGSRGYFPLYVAADWGFPEAVRLLLAFGADRAMYCNEGWFAEDRAQNFPDGSDIHRRVGKREVRRIFAAGRGAPEAIV